MTKFTVADMCAGTAGRPAPILRTCPIVAIDPGANGGYAFQNNPGHRPVVMPMASDATDCTIVQDLLLLLSGMPPRPLIVIEDVGGYRPGNSGPAATTFALHVGLLRGTILAHAIRQSGVVAQVEPARWMRGIGVPTGMEKKARKNWIKARMAEANPHLKVTLATSDALGILAYARNGGMVEDI